MRLAMNSSIEEGAIEPRCTIFAGPSVRAEDRGVLPHARWLPPAQRGDVYLAAKNASVIGLIDGSFRTVPAVMHKEILWALAQGVAVYGAASMGALRAAELHTFGMIGVGRIYQDFIDGRLWRDDEVAVEHGPAKLGFPVLSEALVNIRATIAHAAGAGRISTETAGDLICTAGRIPYADRTYPALVSRHNATEPRERVEQPLLQWIIDHRVDQKRLDAVALLQAIRDAIERGVRPEPRSFPFEDTIFFARLRGFLDNPLLRDRA
jgi:hypothetical protein